MQTLFISDRMIVKGEYGGYMTGVNGEEKVEYLNLEIIFQVNGKLTQYNTSFNIEEDKEINIGEMTLKNWNEWYNICALFHSMGYFFGEEMSRFSGNSIIKEWIKKVITVPIEQVNYKKF